MHVLTFVVAVCLPMATQAEAENPCTNGSFEELAPSGFPADWGPVGATVEVSLDARSGERSLRFLRTADNETVETGLNRGPLIDRLKGGIDFWYKGVSAKSAQLNVQVIPMTADPVEKTGSPRATFTVPEGQIGDGQWRHARLKYDFTDNPKAKTVHFAVRIVGTAGELLLDDVSYVERVGTVLRFGKVRLEEDSDAPGQKCTVRTTIENAGDEPAADVRAAMIVPDGFQATPAELSLGDLAPDKKIPAQWTLTGSRTEVRRFEFTAVSGTTDAETSLAVAPKLTL
ncbi:MAG: NEW3 domain-containing protein, partial [Planctomycetota bacterium]